LIVTVPQIVGSNRTDAVTALAAVRLTMTVGKQENRAEPVNTVAEQQPAAGQQVRAGSAVTVTISLGPEQSRTVVVPRVVGLTTAVATQNLRRVGLEAEINDEGDIRLELPRGTGGIPKPLSRPLPGNRVATVTGQRPPAGAKVDRGSTVTLDVG
jgi:serine/threonine-protein kinase